MKMLVSKMDEQAGKAIKTSPNPVKNIINEMGLAQSLPITTQFLEHCAKLIK